MTSEQSSPAPRRPLSAVIVNHEHWPAVLEQLAAYRADDPQLFEATEWHVVHNGPEPPPAEDLAHAKALDGVKVAHVRNDGYAAAINRVVRETSRPWILALNADLLPLPGTLRELARLLAEQEEDQTEARAGVIGFRLQNEDGTEQGSAGPFPSLPRLLFGLSLPRSRRKYLATTVGDAPAAEVPWVTGAAVLFSRTCWEHVGGWDEGFFMYNEDVDFCRRATDAGFRVRLDRRITFRHLYPYHSRPLTIAMVALARPSLLRYFFKHRTWWERWGLAGIILAECRWRQWRAAPEEKEGWRAIHRSIAAFLREPSLPDLLRERSLPEVVHELPKSSPGGPSP